MFLWLTITFLEQQLQLICIFGVLIGTSFSASISKQFRSDLLSIYEKGYTYFREFDIFSTKFCLTHINYC